MADVTLQVPAQHAERFRDALRSNLAMVGDSLAREKVPAQIHDDLHRFTTFVRVLDEVGWEGPLGDVTATVSSDDAHAFADEWIFATAEEITEEGDMRTLAERLDWIDLLRGWLLPSAAEAARWPR